MIRFVSLNLGVVSDGELLQFLRSLAQHAVRDAIEDVDQHTCSNKHIVISNQLSLTNETFTNARNFKVT